MQRAVWDGKSGCRWCDPLLWPTMNSSDAPTLFEDEQGGVSHRNFDGTRIDTQACGVAAEGAPTATPPVLKLAALVVGDAGVSEGWVVQVQVAVRLDEAVAAQILVEAMDLVAVAGLEEVEHVMDSRKVESRSGWSADRCEG